MWIVLFFIIFSLCGMNRENKDLASCDNLACFEELEDNFECINDNDQFDIEKGITKFFYAFTLQRETDEATIENSTTDKGDGR